MTKRTEYKKIISKISIPADHKIKQKAYLQSGTLPVIDQGQKLIGGYTNDCPKQIVCDLPVIVFGDHTKNVKYINFPFCAGADGIKILKVKDDVFPKYLYYGTIFLTYCIEDKGYARHYQHIEKQELSVPPLPEQERIVAKIEELFSQLDAAVAELKSVKEKLAIYRQAVLKEAFEKYNKGMVQLKHIAVSRLGKMLDKSKNTGNTHKYLRNINVRWLGFDTTDLLDIKIEDYEVEKFSIAFDDLIMCEGGEPGRCAVWKNKESICFQKALHRIRFLDDSIPEFYMYLFYYYAQTGVLKPYFTGSGIKHLTGEKLETVLVPKAPRDEQNSTVNYIEKKLSICNNIEQNVDTALQQAAALRQSILKQAFEGKL